MTTPTNKRALPIHLTLEEIADLDERAAGIKLARHRYMVGCLWAGIAFIDANPDKLVEYLPDLQRRTAK